MAGTPLFLALFPVTADSPRAVFGTPLPSSAMAASPTPSLIPATILPPDELFDEQDVEDSGAYARFISYDEPSPHPGHSHPSSPYMPSFRIPSGFFDEPPLGARHLFQAMDTSACPEVQIPAGEVETHIQKAREQLSRNVFLEAARSYRQAMQLLKHHPRKASPFPLYRLIPQGDQLMLEALAGTIYLGDVPLPADRARSSPQTKGEYRLSEEIDTLWRNLERFQRFIRDEADAAISKTLSKTMIAFLKMKHATSGVETLDGLLRSTSHDLDDITAGASQAQDERFLQVCFAAKLLSVEVLGRLLLHDHHAWNPADRKIDRARLYMAFDETIHILLKMRRLAPSDPYHEYRANLTAHHMSDISRLLLSMKLFKPGLRIANDLLRNPLFEGSQAIETFKSDPLLKPFLKHRDRLPEFSDLQMEDIPPLEVVTEKQASTAFANVKAPSSENPPAKERNIQTGPYARSPLVEGIKAALTRARSHRFRSTAAVTVSGMLIGDGLSHLLGFQQHGAMALGAALLATSFHKLRNGFLSEESRSARTIAYSGLTWKESARGAAGMLLHGGLIALIVTIPVIMLDNRAHLLEIAANTLHQAFEVYASFFQRQEIFARVSSLDRAIDYFSQLPNSLSHIASSGGDLEQKAKGAIIAFLKGGALAFFALQLASPERARRLRTDALIFLPGAIALGADLGQLFAGTQDLSSRYERSLIITMEMVAAVTVAQFLHVALKWRAQGKKLPIVDDALRAIVFRTHWPYIFSGIISGSIASALGGRMQMSMTEQFHYQQHHPIIALVEGTAIALGLLPFAFLTSGLPKSLVPIVKRAREAWQDSSGVVSKPFETLVGASEALGGAAYTENRIKGIFTIWMFANAARAFVGWDTNIGQAIHSFGWLLFAGPAATAIWPEISGTAWEQKAFHQVQQNIHIGQEALAAKRSEEHIDEDLIFIDAQMRNMETFLRRMGHRASLWQPFMPFTRWIDRFAPIFSLARMFRKPTYPHLVNERSVANIHQIVMERDPQAGLSQEGLEEIFAFVERAALRPDAQDRHVAIAWAKMLALARSSERWGSAIQQFFEAKPAVPRLLGLNLEKWQLPHGLTRRQMRRFVQRAVRTPFFKYERACRSYARPADVASRKTLDPETLFAAGMLPQAESDAVSEDDEQTASTVIALHPSLKLK